MLKPDRLTHILYNQSTMVSTHCSQIHDIYIYIYIYWKKTQLFVDHSLSKILPTSIGGSKKRWCNYPIWSIQNHLYRWICSMRLFSVKPTSSWGSVFSDRVPWSPWSSSQVAKLILGEVAALFPDEFLHVGGDEAREDDLLVVSWWVEMDSWRWTVGCPCIRIDPFTFHEIFSKRRWTVNCTVGCVLQSI